MMMPIEPEPFALRWIQALPDSIITLLTPLSKAKAGTAARA